MPWLLSPYFFYVYNNSICLLYRYVVSEFAYFARAKFMSGYNLFCLKNAVSLSIICYFKNIMLTYKCISHPYICEQNILYTSQPWGSCIQLIQACIAGQIWHFKCCLCVVRTESKFQVPIIIFYNVQIRGHQWTNQITLLVRPTNGVTTVPSVDQSDCSASEAHPWSYSCNITGPIRLLCCWTHQWSYRCDITWPIKLWGTPMEL